MKEEEVWLIGAAGGWTEDNLSPQDIFRAAFCSFLSRRDFSFLLFFFIFFSRASASMCTGGPSDSELLLPVER